MDKSDKSPELATIPEILKDIENIFDHEAHLLSYRCVVRANAILGAVQNMLIPLLSDLNDQVYKNSEHG